MASPPLTAEFMKEKRFVLNPNRNPDLMGKEIEPESDYAKCLKIIEKQFGYENHSKYNGAGWYMVSMTIPKFQMFAQTVRIVYEAVEDDEELATLCTGLNVCGFKSVDPAKLKIHAALDSGWYSGRSNINPIGVNIIINPDYCEELLSVLKRLVY